LTRVAQGDVEEEVETKVETAFERSWGVVVWNDPINTMTYVTFVFQKVLKMDRATAERHMLEVHHKGKSLVANETRERAEFLVHQIQSFGLKATMERT
jgi:ATP-dependent Clp protease adaptor protein ClpS